MQRPGWQFIVWAILLLLLIAGFIRLGNWQLERRLWKLDLIAAVDAHANAAPVPAPGPPAWHDGNRDRYRPIHITGHYLHEHETLVHGTSRLGYGYWIMTPLRTSRGFTVLVNRGHIPESLPGTAEFQQMPRPQGEVTVTGLLRLTEPGGGFLRPNRSVDNRWYSRDVEAIAATAALPADSVAPYFIDADAGSEGRDWPAGGLTAVSFRNNHLSYALTWYAMALGVMLAAGLVLRREWIRRRPEA